jgi:hypothetical protein
MQKTLTELKRELELIKSSEIKFGFQCQEISNDIQLVIGKRISTQTIRRICGLLPYEGKLRGFTYGAIIEYIAKKKKQTNSSLSHSNEHAQEILLLLQTLSEIIVYCPENISQKIHLNFLKSLYKNINLIEISLLKVFQNKDFMNLWWNFLPPMDGLVNYAQTWLVPLVNMTGYPDKQRFFESFQIQRKLLSNENLEIRLDQFSKALISNTKDSSMHKSRMCLIIIWKLHEESQLELDRYLEDQFLNWRKNESEFCSLQQWQIAEGLALIKQYSWANRIIELQTSKNPNSYIFFEQMVAYWRMILTLIEKKSALKNQHSISDFQSQIFFAPDFYELIFNQVILKSKYLRDFHEERYSLRSKELLARTGYSYLSNWP